MEWKACPHSWKRAPGLRRDGSWVGRTGRPPRVGSGGTLRRSAQRVGVALGDLADRGADGLELVRALGVEDLGLGHLKVRAALAQVGDNLGGGDAGLLQPRPRHAARGRVGPLARRAPAPLAALVTLLRTSRAV